MRPCLRELWIPGEQTPLRCLRPVHHTGPHEPSVELPGSFSPTPPPPTTPTPPPVTLESMEKAVDELEKRYGDIPIRIEVAFDVLAALKAQVVKTGFPGFETLPVFGIRGISVVHRPDLAAGEWTPVYNVRRRHSPGRAT